MTGTAFSYRRITWLRSCCYGQVAAASRVQEGGRGRGTGSVDFHLAKQVAKLVNALQHHPNIPPKGFAFTQELSFACKGLWLCCHLTACTQRLNTRYPLHLPAQVFGDFGPICLYAHILCH